MIGMEVINEAGETLLNTSDPALMVIQRGTVSGAGSRVEIAYTGFPEIPILFVRPLAGAYLSSDVTVKPGLGRVNFGIGSWSSPSGFGFGSAMQVEYAICCSAKAFPMNGDGRLGIEVFDEFGNQVFSSNRLFPRIQEIVKVPIAYTRSGGVIVSGSAPITKPYEGMPWVGIGQVGVSAGMSMGSGSDVSINESYSIRLNAQKTVITSHLSDTGPKAQGIFNIPLCVIPGT